MKFFIFVIFYIFFLTIKVSIEESKKCSNKISNCLSDYDNKNKYKENLMIIYLNNKVNDIEYVDFMIREVFYSNGETIQSFRYKENERVLLIRVLKESKMSSGLLKSIFKEYIDDVYIK